MIFPLGVHLAPKQECFILTLLVVNYVTDMQCIAFGFCLQLSLYCTVINSFFFLGTIGRALPLSGETKGG
jgi:hypothetical protein